MTVVIDGTLGVDKIQDAIVTPVKTQAGALPSMVRLHTANGYGSTNTSIRRFTTTVLNRGTDITYADSATLGATFTINVDGVYAITYSDSFSAATNMGLSLNSSQLTTSPGSITAADQLVTADSAGVNFNCSTPWTGHLVAGSVIRAHTFGTSSGGAVPAKFTIVRVA